MQDQSTARHGPPRKTDEERYWPRVNLNGPPPSHLPALGGCHLWTGACGRRGYGQFNIRKADDTYTSMPTHRFAWQIWFGPIPDGLWVLHKCDVTNCVRPDHLFLGTVQDNHADMDAKGRRVVNRVFGERNGLHRNPERAPRGERSGMVKWTREQVLEMRARRTAGERIVDIAADMRIPETTVSGIVNGARWRHLLGD